MTRCIGALRGERRPERVPFTKSHAPQFAFQLSADCQVGSATKEIFLIIDRAVFITRRRIERQGGHTESLPGAFGVGSGDDGGMQIKEPFFVKEPVDGGSPGMTNAEY